MDSYIAYLRIKNNNFTSPRNKPGLRQKIVILILVTLLGSCVRVEFDRMEGTSFPTEQFRNGKTHSISSIFSDAGFLVTVDEDDTNISPLNIGGSECISDSELDSLQSGYRSSPLFPTGNTYHLWAVVVDHYGEVNDECSPNFVIGKLLDPHTRSANALFYPHSTIQDSGQSYLRTAVHEIGHALNLHHGDGKTSTTIMNQTGSIIDSWVYEFSIQSQEHLQNHPPKCKFPGAIGGAPYTWVLDEHHVLHPDESVVFNCN